MSDKWNRRSLPHVGCIGTSLKVGSFVLWLKTEGRHNVVSAYL